VTLVKENLELKKKLEDINFKNIDTNYQLITEINKSD